MEALIIVPFSEAHLHEDSQVLTQSLKARERGRFEESVHLFQGRCKRVAHIVRTEMRENPTRYSEEKREGINCKVQRMRSKCKHYKECVN